MLGCLGPLSRRREVRPPISLYYYYLCNQLVNQPLTRKLFSFTYHLRLRIHYLVYRMANRFHILVLYIHTCLIHGLVIVKINKTQIFDFYL